MTTTRTTPQHTPTPYRIVRHNEQQEYPHCAPYLWEVWTQDEDAEQPVALVTDEADAELIVRAVNSHAALVDVVERMRAAHRAQLPSEARDQFGGGCGCPLCEAGRAALAAAKVTK